MFYVFDNIAILLFAPFSSLLYCIFCLITSNIIIIHGTSLPYVEVSFFSPLLFLTPPHYSFSNTLSQITEIIQCSIVLFSILINHNFFYVQSYYLQLLLLLPVIMCSARGEGLEHLLEEKSSRSVLISYCLSKSIQ